MCSPALNLLDTRFAVSPGSAVRFAVAHTIDAVRQMRTTSTEVGTSGFTRIERLRDNVGYMELRKFARVDAACDTVAAAMDYLASCDALVIDLSHNGGGDRRMAALLTSYLFDTEPVHLSERYASPRRPMTGAASIPMDSVPARRLLQRDVYVLIGSETSALGKEFARNLERLRGATVIEDAA